MNDYINSKKTQKEILKRKGRKKENSDAT